MQAMLPACRARMGGIAAWLRLSTPRRFTSSTVSQCAGPISMILSGWVMPALLTRMSSAPKSASTRRRAASQASRLVTSQA